MTRLLPPHLYESVTQLEFLDDTSQAITYVVTRICRERLNLEDVQHIEFTAENTNLLFQIFSHALLDARMYMEQQGVENVILYSIRFGGQVVEIDENINFNDLTNFGQERTTPFQLNPLQSIMDQVQEIQEVYDEEAERIHTLRVFQIWAITTNRIYVPEYETEAYSQITQINRGYFDVYVDLKKAVYYSPGTYTNCLFNAVHFACNAKRYLEALCEVPEDPVKYLDDLKRKICKRSSDIKGNLKEKHRHLTEEDMYTIEVLKDLSTLMHTIIYCVDYKMNKIHTFKPEDSKRHKFDLKEIYLQITSTSSSIHCIAVIPKEQCASLGIDMNDIYKTVDSQNSFDLNRNIYNANVPIQLEEPKHNTRSIVVYDIETFFKDEQGKTIAHKPYMMGIAWGETENEYLEFVTDSMQHTCVYHFWAHILMHWEDFTGKTFFAHNGAKFDALIILQEIPKTLTVYETIVQEGAIISFKVSRGLIGKENMTDYILFRDSMRILPGSLDSLCKSFGVANQKLSFDYHAVNAGNYKEYIEKCRKYLTHDCLGLYQVLARTEKESPGYTNYVTSSSAAQADFYINYYKPNDYRVYRLSDELDGFVRKAYKGGRVEAYKIGRLTAPLEVMDEDSQPMELDYMQMLQTKEAKRLYYLYFNF